MVAVIGGALLGLTGIAEASTGNVVTVIKREDALVRKMPQFKVYDSNLNVKTVSAAKKVIPAIGPLEKASAKAVSVVARSSTSSSREQQGKSLWVKSAEIEDRASLIYRTALRDLVADKQAAFHAVDAKAQKMLAQGVTQSTKADRLLGISIND